MAWSTREIAELAGTTARSVRYYHQVGLLPEPERRSNGYKQYGVPHLVRLLRITRLADLGVGLNVIAELGDGDEHPADALRALDADLEARMDRIGQARAEVARMLRDQLATDLPPELAVATTVPLSEPDRLLTSVLGRLLDPDERRAYAELVAAGAHSDIDDDFEHLPPDADEPVRQDLAVRMTAHLEALREHHPAALELGSADPRGFNRTVAQVSEELYNHAQLDVLRRVAVLYRKAARDRGDDDRR